MAHWKPWLQTYWKGLVFVIAPRDVGACGLLPRDHSAKKLPLCLSQSGISGNIKSVLWLVFQLYCKNLVLNVIFPFPLHLHPSFAFNQYEHLSKKHSATWLQAEKKQVKLLALEICEPCQEVCLDQSHARTDLWALKPLMNLKLRYSYCPFQSTFAFHTITCLFFLRVLCVFNSIFAPNSAISIKCIIACLVWLLQWTPTLSTALTCGLFLKSYFFHLHKQQLNCHIIDPSLLFPLSLNGVFGV